MTPVDPRPLGLGLPNRYEVAPKVSNQLSNYCGADRQPPLDQSGTFSAPNLAIDDHLTCFTRKRSLFQGDHDTVAV
jgi:hypothetical protein